MFSVLLMISGCAGVPYAGVPYKDDFSQVDEAILQQDWMMAYRRLELNLISPEPGIRQQAFSRVEHHPEIRLGAKKSFDKDALTASYKLYGVKMAVTVEKNRLDYYRRSIATPEEYIEAENNFHEIFDKLIAENKPLASLEDEIQATPSRSASLGKRGVADLLDFLAKPKIRRSEIIPMLGRPSSVFEKGSILAWWLRITDDQYSVKSALSGEVTHCLVLVFDQNTRLIEHNLVKIEPGNTDEMLASLSIGQVSRREVLARLGAPSRHFEQESILTWFMRVEGNTYSVVSTLHHTDATHSLVVVFTPAGTLSEKSFVRIVR